MKRRTYHELSQRGATQRLDSDCTLKLRTELLTTFAPRLEICSYLERLTSLLDLLLHAIDSIRIGFAMEESDIPRLAGQRDRFCVDLVERPTCLVR